LNEAEPPVPPATVNKPLTGPQLADFQEPAIVAAPKVAQGEVVFSLSEIMEAIDIAVKVSQRVRFVSIRRRKMIFSSLEPLADEDVEKRILAVVAALIIAEIESPPIQQALREIDAIALLA
jgi:hypothetical protein